MNQAYAIEKHRFRPCDHGPVMDQMIASLDEAKDAKTRTHVQIWPAKLDPIVTSTEIEVGSSSDDCMEAQQDTGRGAYKTLVAAILFESVVLGLPLAYGVFQDHYSKEFPGNNIAPWIGVLSTGIPFLGAPAVAYSCQHYNVDVRYYLIAGWSLCVLSLSAAVFCKSLGLLVVTQGLLYGIGSLLVDIPMLTLINTWFDKRRGIAYGLIFGGADLLSIGYTFLITHLLVTHGFRATVAVLVAIVFVLGGPPMLYLRARARNARRGSLCTDAPYSASPESHSQWQIHVPSKRYYRRTIFYILTIANLLQAFAFYLPFIYLPSFTTDLGYSANHSALVLSIANLAQVFGEVGFGKLSDKIHVKYLVIISTIIASISAFVLWGIFAAKSMAALLVFAFIFGSFGSGFLALWARMGTLFGESDAPMVYSMMCFGRGIGSIVSGPTSSMLLVHSQLVVDRFAFGAGKYFGIVLFVGTCMAGSAIISAFGIMALACRNKSTNGGKILDSEPGSRISWLSNS